MAANKTDYVALGSFLAMLAGFIFSTDALFVGFSAGYEPYNKEEGRLIIPFFRAGLHDFCAACVITSINFLCGNLPDVGRAIVSKPGRWVMCGALFGSLFGMGGYMTSLQMAGPAYVLPITTLYPAVGAILAVFVLNERLSGRAWFGLALCIIGAGTLGYARPGDQSAALFYPGLAFAALAALGWGTEGVLATFGMRSIKPVVALNIYFALSSTLYILIIVPSISLTVLAKEGGLALPAALLMSKGAFFVALAGCSGAMSYLCWYRAMSMIGAGRAMALNISYALWGIVLAYIFTSAQITINLAIGALIILFGMFMVIGMPFKLNFSRFTAGRDKSFG